MYKYKEIDKYSIQARIECFFKWKQSLILDERNEVFS